MEGLGGLALGVSEAGSCWWGGVLDLWLWLVDLEELLDGVVKLLVELGFLGLLSILDEGLGGLDLSSRNDWLNWLGLLSSLGDLLSLLGSLSWLLLLWL